MHWYVLPVVVDHGSGEVFRFNPSFRHSPSIIPAEAWVQLRFVVTIVEVESHVS